MINLFATKRYITIGIKQLIPIFLQQIMWDIIDNLIIEKRDLDYLQVFEFISFDEEIGLLIHRQEEPRYEQKFLLNLSINEFREILNKKIFVIDSLDYWTMMLADEY